jgi:hypothetical protein
LKKKKHVYALNSNHQKSAHIMHTSPPSRRNSWQRPSARTRRDVGSSHASACACARQRSTRLERARGAVCRSAKNRPDLGPSALRLQRRTCYFHCVTLRKRNVLWTQL